MSGNLRDDKTSNDCYCKYTMNTARVLFTSAMLLGMAFSAAAQSRLEAKPDVVELADHLDKPVRLTVITDARVFGDKDGKTRLGTLVKDQIVTLEFMTDRAYKVRGKGAHNGIAGWVSPKAFSSADPDFEKNLKAIYTRAIEVEKVIAAGDVAIGMTEEEVKRSIGEPTKRSQKRTTEAVSSKWEYVQSDIDKHYQLVQNRFTGQVFRRFSHSTVVETSRLELEFADGVVTSISESEDEGLGNVRIVVPPIVYRY